jgi:hypothetical protein
LLSEQGNRLYYKFATLHRHDYSFSTDETSRLGDLFKVQNFSANSNGFVLFRRDTLIAPASQPNDPSSYVLKISWQELRRTHEYVVVEETKEVGEDGKILDKLPKLIAHREFDHSKPSIPCKMFEFPGSGRSRTLYTPYMRNSNP